MNDTGIQLSLCIPTNGVVEWVEPVLNSIYEEKSPAGSFEVVVTDNGDNEAFHVFMTDYCRNHPNLIYKKTNAFQFQNQIEAFRLATGKFIKFVNHRTFLLPGALNYLLNFVAEHEKEKPVVYFQDNKCAGEYKNFDHFVAGLSYWSSYSGGVAMWKSDFDQMDLTQPFNRLFPHTNMIFSVKDRSSYIIDGHKLVEALPTDETKKGKYNLFYAFAVEYPSIILKMYQDGDISLDTFKSVKDDNFGFLANLYTDYILLKKPCSYILDQYKENLNVFYENKTMFYKVAIILLKKAIYRCKVAVAG